MNNFLFLDNGYMFIILRAASIANNSKDFPMIFEIATKKFKKKEMTCNLIMKELAHNLYVVQENLPPENFEF